MATYGATLRRGLPRTPGGDAWPPAGDPAAGLVEPSPVAPEAAPVTQTDRAAGVGTAGADAVSPSTDVAAASADGALASAGAAGASAGSAGPSAPAGAADQTGTAPAARGVTLRQGLPRVAGGDPWPPASIVAAAPASAPSVDLAPAAPVAEVTASVPSGPVASESSAASAAAGPAVDVPAPVAGPAHAAAAGTGAEVRRGLPRLAGGEPWPPAGTTAAVAAPLPSPDGGPDGARSAAALPAPAQPAPSQPASAEPAGPPAGVAAAAAPVTPVPPAEVVAAAPAAPAAAPAAPAEVAVAPAAAAMVPASGVRAPLTVPRTVWPGRAAMQRPAPRPEPARIGPYTRAQWAGIVIVGGGALLVAGALAVLLVRVLLSMPFGQDFLAAYPGEYHLPEGAPVGFPAWLGWQHFFNAFLMVLIIRTGITIRTEKRPTVFWAPRRDPKGKTSLTIWFHQSLDVLWLVNGAVFVVLLFVSGQWMRIVPTSWEVFPNALSAALQYVSLDWPTENGWVNYNSLQQLAYFTTVFVAAPLAAITGYRMSGLWPKRNARLNAAYPIEWARRIHFPVMLYFVAFIVVHVALVFATGALRNLNHMYAAQGSVDGVAYADNWTGFWIFALSMLVIAAAWVAARPLTLTPIARLFGTVSGR